MYLPQAVYKHHASLHMTELTRHNHNAKTALKMAMALPLLPPQLIEDGLRTIREYLRQHTLVNEFQVLIDYLYDTWIMRTGPERLSVYGQVHRTNNGVEGFHADLQFRMGRRPGVWDFTGNHNI